MDTTQAAFEADVEAVCATLTDPKWAQPAGKLTKAKGLVLAGAVTPTDVDDTYRVKAPGEGDYTVGPSGCACPDTRRSPTCKHVAAVEIYTGVLRQRWSSGIPKAGQGPAPADPASLPRESLPPPPAVAPTVTVDEKQLGAQKHQIRTLLVRLGLAPTTREAYESATMEHTGLLLTPEHFPLIIDRLSELVAALPPVAPPAERRMIPREYIMQVHGNDHVRYDGLLAMAHEEGLITLSEEFVSVTETLAVAQATATFKDGRCFRGAADATPTNVPKGVAASWVRMSLTRAKARALRDALNIGDAAAEEMP